jgi:hypothetical protein
VVAPAVRVWQGLLVVKELLTREDSDGAIAGREGVIVIVDDKTQTRTAHPLGCRHVQRRHFVQKVIVNERKNGSYWLAGSFAEVRSELDAQPCQS